MARLLLVVVVVFAAAAVVLLRSDGRASALCGTEGFSVASPSLWPPGATCFGGDPSFETTMFDPLYLLVLVVVSVGLFGANVVAPGSRARPSPKT